MIECQPSDRHFNTTKYRPYILEAEAFFYRHYKDESLRKKYSYQIACQNNYTITKITIIINKDLEDIYEQKKADFNSRGIPSHVILAFHATQE